jgi:hypothetical protein
MRTTLVAGLAAIAGFAGWASAAGARLSCTTGPIVAILAGDPFLGEAEGKFDGSGTIRIRFGTYLALTARSRGYTVAYRVHLLRYKDCLDNG